MAHVTREEFSEVSTETRALSNQLDQSEPGGIRYVPTKMLRINHWLSETVKKHGFKKIYFENERLPMLVRTFNLYFD